jgi:phenylpropionate dioxygenase-like ring-hydroxylating dioxygenase large terminal subunit
MLIEARVQTIQSDELPAGGADPAQFDWQEVWYPVFYIDDLNKATPSRFTLLGRDLVIWWDRRTNRWCALDDQCPHRLAPLSEGRIAEDGLLECPYHGWAFTGEGVCDRIPQQHEGGTSHTSQRACVASLPTAVEQGLLFVYAGQPDNAARVKIPVIDPLEDGAGEWVCLNTFRDLPYDALTLMENVLDSSHVPFTHHRSVGNRINAAPVDLEVVESSRQGFNGVWEEGPRKGTLGRQITRFIAPGLMWHDLTSKQFGRTVTAVYATPIRKGECRLFARFPFKFSSKFPAFIIQRTPRWYSHMGQNGILEDDQIFLHYQEHYLEAKGGSAAFAKAFYLPTRADRFVAELRKWVNTYDANPFPGEPLPSRLSTEALLDRYHSHTEKCASCRTALANIKQLRLTIAIAGAIAFFGLPLLSVMLGYSALVLASLLAAIPLVAGAAWLGLGRLERQFYEGRRIPPRNLFK